MDRPFAYVDIYTAVFVCCATLTGGHAALWHDLRCFCIVGGPETNARVSAWRLRHMTFASAVSTRSLWIEQAIGRGQAKESNIHTASLCLVQAEPNSQGIAAVKWFEQVVLERGHPRKS